MSTEIGNGRPQPVTGYSPKRRIVRLHRSGNSFGLYIPRTLARNLHWQQHDYLDCYVVGDTLCFRSLGPDSRGPGLVRVTTTEPVESESGGEG